MPQNLSRGNGTHVLSLLSPIQAVCVPADNFTAPAAVHTFLQISASIVLSRRRAGEGQYLAIAPNQA